MPPRCRSSLKKALTASTFISLLAGASPGFAESGVQLYGLVDEWVGARKLPGGERAVRVSGGGMSTSYWGLRGAEDLGGSYKAVFSLEGFFRAENGQYGRFTGDPFFARNAYAGIDSPYGRLVAGRLTTRLFLATIGFNPFGDSYVFSPMVYHTYLGLGTSQPYPTDQGALGDSGWNNAIQYSSPDFKGLSASAMYALGNTPGQNGAKKWSAQFTYSGGAFAASGVFQYVNFSQNPGDLAALTASMKSQSVAQLGLTYDLAFMKLYGQYMYSKNDRSSQGSWHVNTAQGGVSVPAGTGKILASYAYSHDSGGLDLTRQTWALAYDYPFSKRTDLYAGYLNDHISGQSNGNTFGAGIRSRF
ncbi:porin [Paraburkholderia hayleyella]|uniref:porin n=1 Tax=Paraburkholderia hayleyella TaxID=2152889 RepID=UPI0012925AB9|nr:porin [Paraburkholderia hayleyella]